MHAHPRCKLCSKEIIKNTYDHSLDALHETKHQCMIKNNVIVFGINKMKKYIQYIDKTYGKQHLKSFKVSKEK